MLPLSHRRFVVLAITAFCVATGLVFLAYPVSTEETGPVYSVSNVSVTQIIVPVGYAPPNYYAAVQVSSANDGTLTLSVLLGTSRTEIFRSDFQAGNFEVSSVSVGTGGTVFLTVGSSGDSITKMSVYARIFHLITAYPYAFVGLGALVLAGIVSLAAWFPHTSFGKVATKLLPVDPGVKRQATAPPDEDV